ncbi:MAG TPA: hypothetical protein VFG69_05515 [Nannocystaceae bacterium]|nr:hypothetical protein [Nannocystaceae bacterium]
MHVKVNCIACGAKYALTPSRAVNGFSCVKCKTPLIAPTTIAGNTTPDANECPGCGGPRRSNDAETCEYCGAVLPVTVAKKAARRDAAPAPPPSREVLLTCGLLALVTGVPALLMGIGGLVSDDFGSGTAVPAGVLAGFSTMFWLLARVPALGVLVSGIVALALVLKPFVAPIVVERRGGVRYFSLTSETHLYFLVTGGVLVLFTLLVAINVKWTRARRQPVRGSSSRAPDLDRG